MARTMNVKRLAEWRVKLSGQIPTSRASAVYWTHFPRVSRYRGLAAVEFAIILPLLMLIILGCVDFGRFAYTYIAVTNATRTGALFGALNPYTTATQSIWGANIRQKVVDDLNALMTADPDYGPTDLAVTSTRMTEASGLWRAHVEVSYPFKTVISWPGIPSNLTLRRTVEMRGIR
jgi:Flp pilus assembly protein TadG